MSAGIAGSGFPFSLGVNESASGSESGSEGAFDGFAIGGLAPRCRDRKLVLDIVAAVRAEVGDRPLHVFGLGRPDLRIDDPSVTDRLHIALRNLAAATGRALPLSAALNP